MPDIREPGPVKKNFPFQRPGQPQQKQFQPVLPGQRNQQGNMRLAAMRRMKMMQQKKADVNRKTQQRPGLPEQKK